MKLTVQIYDQLVGQIYDCAACPELWPETLENVRLAISAAYVLLGVTDTSVYSNNGQPTFNYWHSPWDNRWLDDLVPRLKDIPRINTLYNNEIETAWLQLDCLTEKEFFATSFYSDWVKPQGLYDVCNIITVRREKMLGMFSAPIFNNRPRYSAEEITFMTRLIPHLRRSMSIGDIVDKGKQSQRLYRSILDTLSVAVVVLDHASQIVYANGEAERLFEEGSLIKPSASKLVPKKPESQLAMSDAIARAATSDAAIGISGIGIPLYDTAGQMASAYVLPLGNSDFRNFMQAGHVAVFIARRAEQQPAAIEILRTMFNLSLSEARTTMQLLDGKQPQQIADALGVSVNTTRTHLSSCFTKTGTKDQTSLVAYVRDLLPPINF